MSKADFHPHPFRIKKQNKDECIAYRHGRKSGAAKNQDNAFPLRVRFTKQSLHAAILSSKNTVRNINKYIVEYRDGYTSEYAAGYTGGYMSDFIIFFGISAAEMLYIPY